MKNSQSDIILNDVVEHLCRPESYAGVYHLPSLDSPMPSADYSDRKSVV